MTEFWDFHTNITCYDSQIFKLLLISSLFLKSHSLCKFLNLSLESYHVSSIENFDQYDISISWNEQRSKIVKFTETPKIKLILQVCYKRLYCIRLIFYFNYKGTFSEQKPLTSPHLGRTTLITPRIWSLDPLAVLHLDNQLYISRYSRLRLSV